MLVLVLVSVLVLVLVLVLLRLLLRLLRLRAVGVDQRIRGQHVCGQHARVAEDAGEDEDVQAEADDSVRYWCCI